ncbi:MAG: hypothetical protein K1X53_01105 [Candidatus Sumerlaeaceae bacterium]|nr:hypothetical protein [Candidatus Sumerlaeaceae bacterium]
MLDLEHSIDANRENRNQYRVTMRVTVHQPFKNDSPDGPKIDAEIRGYFECPDNMPDNERSGAVSLNGTLILYGILRGQLSLIAPAFSVSNVFTLPSFDVHEFFGLVKGAKSVTKPRGLPRTSRRTGI